MSSIELITKPSYGSIFWLTVKFQDKENGLQSKHYRYSLVKGNNIKTQLKYLKTFFQDETGNNLLETAYKDNHIQKDCITGDNLKNFLKLMVNKGILKIINPKEKNKKYKVTINFLNCLSKDWIENEVKKWQTDRINDIFSIVNEDDLNLSQEKVIAGYLYGFPTDSLPKFQEADIEIVEKNMLIILKSTMELNKVLSRYSQDGISKISLFLESAIQPQLIEPFEFLNKLKEKLVQRLNEKQSTFNMLSNGHGLS